MKKIQKKYVFISAFIVIIILLVLWIFGIFDYCFSGMAALPNERTDNVKISLSNIPEPVKVELSIKELDQNKNLILYENRNCKITIDNTYVSNNENALYIRLNCFGTYDLTQTLFYTPQIENFQVGKLYLEGDTYLPVLLKVDGPMKRDHYIMELCVSNINDIATEKASLEIPGFVEHYYQRTGWI